MSEMTLRKELEQGTFPFPPSGQQLRISNQCNCLEEDVCLYRHNAR